jgi:hypothetical protein
VLRHFLADMGSVMVFGAQTVNFVVRQKVPSAPNMELREANAF